MIALINYGAGNLLSVKKAFDYLGEKSNIISSATEFNNYSRVVLPGVGAFGSAVDQLKKAGFYNSIIDWIHEDKPFLGICLGVQLLMEESLESIGARGLSIFNGNCLPFKEGKVPQIGWNNISIKQEIPLLDGIKDKSYFYFLHSYYVAPEDSSIITATTEYGLSYPSIIRKGNIHAVQFHPEKSGDVGMKLLKNWIQLC